MKLSKITLYQNTPFTDFQNTINFGNNNIRDQFFDTHYVQKTTEKNFNFIRDRLNLSIPSDVADWYWLSKVNYVRFTSDFDGITYYAMCVNSVYQNNGATKLELVIDGLMTFCQGDISKYVKNVQIDRQHLTDSVFKNNLKYLRSNDDILNVNPLQYVHQDAHIFSDLGVVIMCSADLAQDFGDEDDPKFVTSAGLTHDGITSPQNLYYVDYTEFTNLTSVLQKYPWISQNMTKVVIIPKEFIDTNDLFDVTMKTGGFKKLKGIKDDSRTNNLGRITELTHSVSELSDKFGYPMIDNMEIFRPPYAGMELLNYQGQSVDINPVNLPDSGLEIIGQVSTGFDNKAYFFPSNYNESGENQFGNAYPGSYLLNSLVFDQWDNVPILIDNYKLDKASTANQRALAENNQLSGMAGNVVDKNADLQTRLMSAISLTSNLSLSSLGGKMVDEWQFYRKQKAEFADKKISQPTVTSMTNTNSFAIKQKTFGVFLKYSRLDNDGMKFVKRYHKHFGYQWNRIDDLQPIDSMYYLNYAKFSGNWIINDRNVPQAIMEQIRIQFENGVKLWHNPENLFNPFTQDITDINVRMR